MLDHHRAYGLAPEAGSSCGGNGRSGANASSGGWPCLRECGQQVFCGRAGRGLYAGEVLENCWIGKRKIVFLDTPLASGGDSEPRQELAPQGGGGIAWHFNFAWAISRFKLTAQFPPEIQGSPRVSRTPAVHIVDSGGGYHTKSRGSAEFPTAKFYCLRQCTSKRG